MRAAIDGPSGRAVLRLALDTGATATLINVGMLVALGYDPALVPDRTLDANRHSRRTEGLAAPAVADPETGGVHK